jgi:ribosomal protein S12
MELPARAMRVLDEPRRPNQSDWSFLRDVVRVQVTRERQVAALFRPKSS